MFCPHFIEVSFFPILLPILAVRYLSVQGRKPEFISPAMEIEIEDGRQQVHQPSIVKHQDILQPPHRNFLIVSKILSVSKASIGNSYTRTSVSSGGPEPFKMLELIRMLVVQQCIDMVRSSINSQGLTRPHS